jgi:4'-phosphopantetheinyl transferase
LPFIPIIKTDNYQLGLWHITESAEELASFLVLTESNNFSKDSRNLHWLAARVLLKHLLGGNTFDLLKTDTGKPYLPDDDIEISLSHSGDYAAAIICNKEETGVDIEKIDPRIYRIAHKFLNDFDKSFLTENDLVGHYLVWNAKEVLFKYYSKGAVDFRKHLFIDLSNRKKNELTATIKKEDFNAEISIQFKIEGEYVLTWINHQKKIIVNEQATK